MNMAPDKRKSADKIDDACALFMAIGVMTERRAPLKTPEHQLMFIGR
jgi:phage terminase large subunit-like protein